MSRSRPNHDLALDLWFLGTPTEQITARCNYGTDAATCSAIARARNAGDKRAIRRHGLFNHGMSENYRKLAAQNVTAMVARRKRESLARKFPITDRELAAATANYSGPVTICPPGAHMGWVPEWIRNL